MLNTLKFAWRLLLRNGSYSLINIIGLSLSIGIALDLFQAIRFENSFDSYHKKANRVYELLGTSEYNELNSQAPMGVLKTLRTQIPGIEKVAAVHEIEPQAIKIGNRIFDQPGTFFVHPEIFEMLDVDWISGAPKKSLSAPFQAVLDEPTAFRLFGTKDAVGKTFRLDNRLDITVTGLIKTMPRNSDFQFRMILSFETLKKYDNSYANENTWGGGDSHFQGYILLAPTASPDRIAKQLTAMALQKKEESAFTSFQLEPIASKHFNTEIDAFNYVMPKWLLYALGYIGAFLILIACINYINIATVQSIQRNREIGIRKLLGGGRRDIISRFLTETSLTVLLSLGVGVVLSVILMPFTSGILNSQATVSDSFNGNILAFILLLGVAIVLISGLYPAFASTGLQPLSLLRQGAISATRKGILIRRSLVVLQLVIAQLLVIATLAGVRQINYFYSKDLGFAQEGRITVPMPDRAANSRARFRDMALRDAQVADITFGLTTPSGQRNWWWTDVAYRGTEKASEQYRMQFCDTNYLTFFNIPLLAGRQFNASDTNNVIVNSAAVKDMGYDRPELAIGQKITFWGNAREIIGVTRDYHSQGLRTSIPPHLFVYQPWNFRYAMIRLKPGWTNATLVGIEKKWQTIFPDNYYQFDFLDADIRKFYQNEKNLTSFLSLFALAGIVIGCLGLYGLISFVIAKRNKEVSVRKVLGARIADILVLLSKEFFQLSLISFLIAVPLSWWLIQYFLADYAYKMDPSWWIFILSGIGAMFITLSTVIIQTLRAAFANPAKTLRSD